MAVRVATPLKAEERETNLANSLSAADDAIALAMADGDSNTKARGPRTQIGHRVLIQGRPEDAARLAREAFGADPTDLQGRLAMAQVSVSMGNLDEGIRILEEAYPQADHAPHVSFMLGQALMARGTVADLSRAIDVFSSAKLENLDRELIDPVVVSTARALIRAKRFPEVTDLVTKLEVASSVMLVATIKGYAAFNGVS